MPKTSKRPSIRVNPRWSLLDRATNSLYQIDCLETMTALAIKLDIRGNSLNMGKHKKKGI